MIVQMTKYLQQSFLLFFLALSGACSTKQAQQRPVTAWNFDWDDNIAYMPTKIILFEKKNGKEKAVSTDEFSAIREHVGKDGEWKKYTLRAEDRVKGSYRNFSDHPDKNPFLDDLKFAVEEQSKEQWQGPSWESFRLALASPVTAARTTIITARGHSEESMLAALQYLKDKGYFQNLPPKENLFGVSSAKWKGVASSPSNTKAQIMLDLLDKLEKEPVPENIVQVWNQNGDAKASLHLWGFSDDDYGNYEAAFKKLGPEVAKGRWPHVKITLFYTGFKKANVKPHSRVIKSDGTLREKLPDEHEGLPLN